MLDTKRIAKNTSALYLRMLLSIVISLYTSRVVLKVLGIEDYGVYAIVGGITSMLSFINVSMGGASSRFLSYEIGAKNNANIPTVFTTAIIIHVIISIIFLFFAETLGLWIVADKINIPQQSHDAALWIYQFTIFSSIIGILRTPYSAFLIAYEKINVYAYIEIIDVVLKLCAVLLLTVVPGNKLICYGFLLLLTALCSCLIQVFYVIRNYKESKFAKITDKHYFKPMLSFSGWNLLGDVGFTLRQNGSNIVLNLFFGPIVNAANGIAMTIQGVVMSLATNTITAVRPPIIKSYSSGNLNESGNLIASGSIVSYIIMLMISGPLILNIDYVLTLWLASVPEYCSQFTIVCLLSGAVACFSNVIYIGSQAASQIKRINLARFIIYTTSLGCLYLFLSLGFPPITAYIIILIVLIITAFINIFLLKRIFSDFPISNTMFRFCCVSVLFGGILFAIESATDNLSDLVKLLVSSISFCAIYISVIFYSILSKRERAFIISLCSKIRNR